MAVHEILFIAWGVVFAMWLAKQYRAHNRRQEEKRKSEGVKTF